MSNFAKWFYQISLHNPEHVLDESLAKSAWNARGKVDAEICQGRIGGATKDDLWWDGFRAAMKQCAKAIEQEKTE